MCKHIKEIFKTSANSVIDFNDDSFKVRNVLSTIEEQELISLCVFKFI